MPNVKPGCIYPANNLVLFGQNNKSKVSVTRHWVSEQQSSVGQNRHIDPFCGFHYDLREFGEELECSAVKRGASRRHKPREQLWHFYSATLERLSGMTISIATDSGITDP